MMHLQTITNFVTVSKLVKLACVLNWEEKDIVSFTVILLFY